MTAAAAPNVESIYFDVTEKNIFVVTEMKVFFVTMSMVDNLGRHMHADRAIVGGMGHNGDRTRHVL